MKIIIAGATGFVGTALIKGLLDDGHTLVILQRPKSKAKAIENDRITVIRLDPEKPFDEPDFMADAVINVTGIIREFRQKGVTFHGSHFLVAKNFTDHAVKFGINRFLQISALGVRPDSHTGYFSSKFQAERYVKESGIPYTIFRPAIIVGPKSHFVELLAGMVKALPVVPVIGNGNYRIQFVHIDDLVSGFRRSLMDENSIGKTFEFGSDIMTYNQALDTIGKALGKRKVCKIHQPLWLIRPTAEIFGSFSWFPITSDQITMLLEDNITLDKTYWQFLDKAPIRLEDDLKNYIGRS